MDEEAVAHAFRVLGHSVRELPEDQGHWSFRIHADLLLFNKWSDAASLEAVRQAGKIGKIAMWYWDLVDFPADPTLARRCQQRKEWMARMLPLVDKAFMTDGDFVEAVNDPRGCWKFGKVVWLPQGADERVVGRGDARCPHCGMPGGGPDILFTGVGRGGGQGRVSFVEEMKTRYGDRFKHVEHGLHGRRMADAIAQARIVVAPDSPVTDRYCSNRVWNVLGFGGFLVHPATKSLSDLAGCFMPYRSRDDMHELIRDYLELPESRWVTSEVALENIKQEHLYRHRCEQLLKEVFG